MGYERAHESSGAETRGAARPSAASGAAARIEALQHSVGNAALARALAGGRAPERVQRVVPGGPVLARVMSYDDWKIRSAHPQGKPRSWALRDIDRALRRYERARAIGDVVEWFRWLERTEGAIAVWRARNPQSARRAAVDALRDEVMAERLVSAGIGLPARLDRYARDLLDALPAAPAARAEELFTRYRAFLRRRGVRYALRPKPGRNVWEDVGPFSCGTLADGLRDLARSAGLVASTQLTATGAFISAPLDADLFVEPRTRGNIKNAPRGRRRFFFTQHYVTEIAGRYFCPTTGTSHDRLEVGAIVAYGNLARVGNDYARDGVTVRRVGTCPSGEQYEVDGFAL